MVDYLKGRHVASFTVDVVSNDSYIGDAARLARETLAKVDANHGGIILFHDIKASTAKALPVILDALAARGYSVVHLTAKAPMQPQRDLMAGYEPQVAKVIASRAKTEHAMVPFFGTVGPEKVVRSPATDSTAAPQSAGLTTSLRGNDNSGWSTTVRRPRPN